ncbi:MAG: hypothetical protein OEY91_09630, partial [Nitrospirota bacterium]|nr:hypothetical protein [Nitrospirota bacterium]
MPSYEKPSSLTSQRIEEIEELRAGEGIIVEMDSRKSPSFGHTPQLKRFGKLPLSFEENHGQ